MEPRNDRTCRRAAPGLGLASLGAAALAAGTTLADLGAKVQDLDGLRALKISLRALHVRAGVLTGAYRFQVPAAERAARLLATIASGGAILALDLYQTAAFLLQVRGLVLALKVALLLALPAFGPAARWVIVALLLLSVVSSHAPSKVRDFVLVGRGRVRGSTAAG